MNRATESHARPARARSTLRVRAAAYVRAVALAVAVAGTLLAHAFAAGTASAAAPAAAPAASAAAARATASAASSREAPPPLGTPRPFALAEKQEIELPNGLRATFVPIGTAPKATVLVAIRTGNIDDGRQTGLADITSELLQQGAGGRSAAEVARHTASMGGSLGVGARADQMTVGIDVLGEHAADAVRLAADVLRRPALPESELPRLKADFARQVAVARASPQATAGEAFARLLWGDHPYGRTLPTDEDIASYSISDIRRFLAENVGAARTHVYVGGRFDRAAVEAAIREAFGDWAPGRPPTENPPTGVRTAQVKLIDRPGAEQSTIVLGTPTIDPTARDYIPLAVTNALLGGAGLISRLDQNLREDKGWTYGVGSQITPNHRSASWAVSADVNTPDTAAAIKEIYRELDRLRTQPPSVDELQRIKNYRAGTFVLGAASRGGLVGTLAFLDLHGLPDEWLRDYVQNVFAVSPEQVQAAAREHLDPATMTLVVVGDMAKIGRELRALPQVKAAQAR